MYFIVNQRKIFQHGNSKKNLDRIVKEDDKFFDYLTFDTWKWKDLEGKKVKWYVSTYLGREILKQLILLIEINW